MKQFILIVILSFVSSILIGQNKIIDPITAQSLKLELYKDTSYLGSATGFVVEKNGKYFLITNWHVFSGVDYYTGKLSDKLGRKPNAIKIWFNGNVLGNWVLRTDSLYDKNLKKRWYELTINNKLVDVVALKLNNIQSDLKVYPFNLDLDKTDMIPVVSMPVSIVGFPYGNTGYGRWPIWKTGHIASDPDLDYDNLPIMMIDATTRPGMSGSPVLLRLGSGYSTKEGAEVYGGSLTTLFLGIYSAQNQFTEIGLVWKPTVIRSLLEQVQ
jgi:Trypsin-like peptidase domain